MYICKKGGIISVCIFYLYLIPKLFISQFFHSILTDGYLSNPKMDQERYGNYLLNGMDQAYLRRHAVGESFPLHRALLTIPIPEYTPDAAWNTTGAASKDLSPFQIDFYAATRNFPTKIRALPTTTFAVNVEG